MFAHTARAESIQILLSIAAADGLFLVQFDIKAAYLNSTIHELIFMELPVRFEEYLGLDTDLCIRKNPYNKF